MIALRSGSISPGHSPERLFESRLYQECEIYPEINLSGPKSVCQIVFLNPWRAASRKTPKRAIS